MSGAELVMVFVRGAGVALTCRRLLVYSEQLLTFVSPGSNNLIDCEPDKGHA